MSVVLARYSARRRGRLRSRYCSVACDGSRRSKTTRPRCCSTLLLASDPALVARAAAEHPAKSAAAVPVGPESAAPQERCPCPAETAAMVVALPAARSVAASARRAGGQPDSPESDWAFARRRSRRQPKEKAPAGAFSCLDEPNNSTSNRAPQKN